MGRNEGRDAGRDEGRDARRDMHGEGCRKRCKEGCAWGVIQKEMQGGMQEGMKEGMCMGSDAGRDIGRLVHKACSSELVAAGDKSNASNPCEGQRQTGLRWGLALEQLPRSLAWLSATGRNSNARGCRHSGRAPRGGKGDRGMKRSKIIIGRWRLGLPPGAFCLRLVNSQCSLVRPE